MAKSLTDQYTEDLSPDEVEKRARALSTAHPGLALFGKSAKWKSNGSRYFYWRRRLVAA